MGTAVQGLVGVAAGDETDSPSLYRWWVRSARNPTSVFGHGTGTDAEVTARIQGIIDSGEYLRIPAERVYVQVVPAYTGPPMRVEDPRLPHNPTRRQRLLAQVDSEVR